MRTQADGMMEMQKCVPVISLAMQFLCTYSYSLIFVYLHICIVFIYIRNYVRLFPFFLSIQEINRLDDGSVNFFVEPI